MNKEKNIKIRHSSLDMPDVEIVKKKQDMLTKAKNKLFNFGGGGGGASVIDKLPESPTKKQGKFSTIECLFKSTHKPIDKIIENKLQKQNSISGCYPIEIQIDDYNNDCKLTRERPSTICVDKIEQNLNTAALALERPRKKLSFKEPEIISTNKGKNLRQTNTLKLPTTPNGSGMKRSISFTNGITRTSSFDDFNLENQAMKIVRTIGQAFEVCHKLEITAPEADINENYDQEETSTQDLLSDRLSDLTSEKCRKDIQSDADLEKLSLTGCDDNYYKENELKSSKYNYMKPHIDILAPPPNCNNKTSSLISAETYSSPHSDILTTESGCLSTNLPPPGSSLSAHHEIQLLKEQLEQQNQQTQAAFAQLQLTREQLAAEQAARMEAQSRTHQLLIHNRELLDHIAALVSHLQNTNENSSGNQPHLTLPQYQQQQEYPDIDYQQNYGFIENRGVTTNSPIKFNPTGTIFNFPSAYPQIHETYDPRLNYYQPYFNKFNYYPNYYPTTPPTASTNYRHNSEPRQFPYFLKKAPIPTTTPTTVTNTNFNEQQKCVLKQQQQQQQNEQRIDEQITKKSNLIKPLPQVGTVTNKDSDGNLRLFVPIKTSTTSTLTNNSNDNDNFLSNLRITDNFQNTQPIQRSTSEKLPISQTPRTIWTRHTTNN